MASSRDLLYCLITLPLNCLTWGLYYKTSFQISQKICQISQRIFWKYFFGIIFSEIFFGNIFLEIFFRENLAIKQKVIYSDFLPFLPLLFVSGNLTNILGKLFYNTGLRNEIFKVGRKKRT